MTQLEFLGKTYQRRFNGVEEGVGIWQFFQQQEWAWNWLERMEIRAYPATGVTPIERATETAKALKQANPKARFALFKDPGGKQAMVDYVTWSEKVPNTIEFNAIKFFWGAEGQGVLSLRYVKRIPTKGREQREVAREVNATRKPVIDALVAWSP